MFAELLKHTTTAEADHQLLYYRDKEKNEVDVVIEDASGLLVGVKVRVSVTVKDSDLRRLKKRVSVAGEKFKIGIRLYDGTETMHLGNGIWATPLST